MLDGVFWISRTGAPWRDLPEVLGNWNSVHKQFRRWCLSGVWDVLLQALADSGGDADVLQMIDSTTAKAHRAAAGGKGGPISRRSAALAAGERQKSMLLSMVAAAPSRSK